MNKQLNPLEDLVGDLFVNREDELELFWEWATNIPQPLGESFALVGRQGTGKTAILVKLFNRLFYEQETVLPVFISFARYSQREKAISSHEFIEEYFIGYASSYLAFRYRQPALLRRRLTPTHLRQLAHQLQDGFILDLIGQYQQGLQEANPYSMMQWVINMPHAEAGILEMPTAMIVDEVQVLTNVYNPYTQRYNDLTDNFQWAVETKWAPMLVSGSTISLLVGGFKYWDLEPLAQEYVYELTYRMAQAFNLAVNDAFAEAMWLLSGGYPYSIKSLMTSLSSERSCYPSLEALENVVSFELTDSSGQLWQYYNKQFAKYSNILNKDDRTKKVMFWATKYPEEEIDAEHIAKEIGADLDLVQDSLRKLYKADIITRVGWTLYEGSGDPMLRRYIEYNYLREIEGVSPEAAIKNWQEEYKDLCDQVKNSIGEVAEIYVEAVMSAFDGRSINGSLYFNYDGAITLPTFERLERGEGGEGAVTATGKEESNTLEVWLIQINKTQAKISQPQVQDFLTEIEKVKAQKEIMTLKCWYISKQGFSANAVSALKKAGILYSNREEFNELAKLFAFVGWPSR